MTNNNPKITESPGAKLALLWVTLILLIAAAIGLSVARSIWRYDDPEVAEFDRSRQGQFDFHNGIYFPARAFVDGVSPYGEQFATHYPVTRPLPLLSPLMPLLHVPLALMPVQVAECLYFAFNVLLMCAIATLSVRWIKEPNSRFTWFLITLVLVIASRAGHTTLFTGYMTAEVVCGALVAVASAGCRPWLSAVGVAITSCKPTYAIPLFLLMIARGDHQPALRGFALSVVGALVGVGRLLLVSSPAQLWADVQHGQSAHMADSYELPINTWTRIDLFALIAKWLNWAPGEATHLAVMVLLLPLAGLALWRLKRSPNEEGAASLSSGIIAVSILATLYHHVYDALAVFPIAIGLVLGASSTMRGKTWIRLTAAALLLFVAWNYPSSEQAVKLTGVSGVALRILTSTGPIALTAAWLTLCTLPFLRPDPQQASAEGAEER